MGRYHVTVTKSQKKGVTAVTEWSHDKVVT